MTPEMEVMNIESESLMLTASANLEVDTTDANFEQRGGDRRGTWGNLWD